LSLGAVTISCPADVNVSCDGEIVAGNATATSGCGNNANVTNSAPVIISGTAGCTGAVYQITYTATDDCGGSASCTQNFTISGGAPTIACPADATVTCIDDISAGTPTTSTSCNVGSTVSTDGPTLISGSDGCDGAVYQITYTVTDDCGGSANCTQNFT